MRKWYVLWTYSANYSERVWTVEANTAEEAAQRINRGFSADFQQRGRVYVFAEPPACILHASKVNDGERCCSIE